MKEIWIFTISFVLALVTAQQSRHTYDCISRNTSGIICSADCKSVHYCLNNGDNWDNIEVEACKTGTSCNLIEGKCTEKTSCIASAVSEIKCTGIGLYPDPFDCQRYHICDNKNADSKSTECLHNYAFNILDNQCTLDLSDAACLEPPFSCEYPGQLNAWKGSNTLYYLCVMNTNSELIPLVYRCELPGKVFDVVKKTCVAKDDVIVPTSPTTEDTNPTEGPSTDPTTTYPSVVCTGTRPMYDPKNCYYYYSCGTGLPIHMRCDPGTYFNANFGQCVQGQCFY